MIKSNFFTHSLASGLGGHQHHHRRRSHEVRSSRLGSYVNGHGEAATEAAEAGATTTAVDNVDLLGNVM